MLAIVDAMSASSGESGRARADTRTPAAGLPAEVVSTPVIDPDCEAETGTPWRSNRKTNGSIEINYSRDAQN
jgi:hypothetical protein